MTDLIQGAKGGGSTPHAATEAPDSLHSIAYARILDLVSEGEILGFKHGAANALQDIYLNETPIANADNSLNFKNVQIDTRTGTQSQGYMPGYPDVENETAVGLELTSATAWTQSLSDLTLSAVRIRLSVPSLQQSNTSTGDITGYTIQYKVELQTDGGSFVTMLTSAFTGKTTSTYERSHRIDLPVATTGWVLRITRLTANQHLATVSDTTTIVSYTAIVDAKFRYPNSALVGVIIDASQFQSIPTRAYDLYGRIISVPTNYDPVARTYTGTWDGTFKPAWTNNPAWIFYDLATNTRYGLGNYVSAALLNKWSLYTIAQYCDGSVSDGFGGMEPRFTCNLYLQAQADAFKVLQDLASVFRGMVYWAGGAIQVVADMPSDPVYTYTQANVIDGKFTYQGSGRKTRFTTALVSWNDPKDFGRAKVEYVPDNAGIARYGIQPTSITGFGCTSQAQAHRLGLWVLLTSRLETETGTFATGLDGTLAAPGQIVRVADAARAGKRQGGRISSATTTAITVDAAPTVAIGDTLTCTLPSGVTETHTVSAVAGKVITVGSAFSVAPLPESAWVVESTTLAAQTFRMLSVLENGTGPNLSFALTGLAHNESKFAAIDTGAPITVPNVTLIPPSNQIGPATVSLASTPTAGAVVASTILTVQWTATANAVWYEVDLRKDNADWQPLGKQLGLSVDVPSVKAGTYLARVRAVNASGIGSVPTVSSALAVADQTMQPTTVTTLQTEVATAQSSANAANAELANIASDGIVSAAEKPTVIRDWSVISSEQAGIDAQAVSFLGAGSAQQVAYDNAITALATYLGTLNSPKMWNDKTGDTNVVGVTFRANFNSVYVTRQTLLNAIYAKAQALANNAQTTANTATGQVTQLPVINGGFDIAPTGYGWTPDASTGWTIDTAGNTPGVGPNSACHVGGTGNGAYRNNGLAACGPGQVYKAQGLIKAVGANGACWVFISWCNAGGGEISSTAGNQITGTITNGSYAVGTAPAGTVYARTCLAVASHTAGTYYVDNVLCSQYPNSIGEVPDGGGRYAVNQVDGSGLAIIDFSQAGHVNKTIDNIADGTQFVRSMQQVASGAAWSIDNALFQQWDHGANTTVPGWIAQSGCNVSVNGSNQAYGQYCLDLVTTSGAGNWATSAKQFFVKPGDRLSLTGLINAVNGAGTNVAVLFYTAANVYISQIVTSTITAAAWTPVQASGVVPSNAAYARINLQSSGGGAYHSLFQFVQVTVNDVRVAGSGAVLGSQLNAPNSLTLNYGASRTATAVTATSAGAVSINAFTFKMGGASVTYSAVSNAVTGLTVGTTYQIYCHDSGGTGGTKTWFAVAGTQLDALSIADDVVIAGQVTIPSTGSSGGGGTGCPDENAWVLRADPDGVLDDWCVQAREVQVGHYLRLTDGRAGLVTHSERKASQRVRVVTTEGDRGLTCSTSAPLELFRGSGDCVLAPESGGRWVSIRFQGWAGAALIGRAEDAGSGYVQHITCQNACFWTGDEPDYLFGHHNLKP